MPFTCEDTGSWWPDVAWCLAMLASHVSTICQSNASAPGQPPSSARTRTQHPGSHTTSPPPEPTRDDSQGRARRRCEQQRDVMQSVNAADKPLDHAISPGIRRAALILPRLNLFLTPAQQDTLTAPVAAVSGLRSGGGCGLPVPGDVG